MARLKLFVVICLCSICIISTNLLAQMNWILATDSAGWLGREGHTSVVLDNKMWVLGGLGSYPNPYHCNDVWYSSDGINWFCATPSAEWTARGEHESVIFNNMMWILGGYDSSWNIRNDVWFSADGVYWTCATDSAQWSPRWEHTTVVFDNKIWVLGGFGIGLKNDVWYSSDGVNWIQAADSAGWRPRHGHASTVFDNKMWVLGGCIGDVNLQNDVWYSTNGVNWICATDSADWSRRWGHALVVFDDKMWLLGGQSMGGNDVWYSTNGVNWICATDSVGWSPRVHHTSVNFNNKIWILGGIGYSYFNDVWYSTGLGIEEHPTLDAGRSIIEIYPNPFRNQLTIHIPNPINSQLLIYDVTGKLIKSFTNSQPQTTNNCFIWNGKDEHNRKVPANLYFAVVKTSKNTIATPIIYLGK